MLKHVVLFFVLVSSLLCSFFGYGMDEQSKHLIEQKNEKYLSRVGTKDVPQKVQSRVDNLVVNFQKKGLLHDNTKVLVKFFNAEMVEKLGAWNRVVNGEDVIHMGPVHDVLTNEEIDSAFGHELAHITLHQKRFLNPHYYMWHLNIGTSVYAAAWPATSFFTVLALVKLSGKKNLTSLKQIKYEVAGTALGVIASSQIGNYLFAQAQEHYNLPVKSPSRVTYPCVEKVEESLCDIIAACSMPHGGKAGRSFYEKVLKNHGDKATRGHPLPSTRVKYHIVIEKVQDLFASKKEGPTIT